jgi:hypothetical protein
MAWRPFLQVSRPTRHIPVSAGQAIHPYAWATRPGHSATSVRTPPATVEDRSPSLLPVHPDVAIDELALERRDLNWLKRPRRAVWSRAAGAPVGPPRPSWARPTPPSTSRAGASARQSALGLSLRDSDLPLYVAGDLGRLGVGVVGHALVGVPDEAHRALSRCRCLSCLGFHTTTCTTSGPFVNHCRLQSGYAEDGRRTRRLKTRRERRLATREATFPRATARVIAAHRLVVLSHVHGPKEPHCTIPDLPSGMANCLGTGRAGATERQLSSWPRATPWC